MNQAYFEIADQLKRRRYRTVMAVLAISIVVLFIISMNTGHIRLSPLELLRTAVGSGTDRQELILFEFRLPRMVMSILIGAGLAVAGTIMQAVTRNALADPGIMGINAGAGLAVMLFISFYETNSQASIFILPLVAWGGAGIAAALVFLLSMKRHQNLSPTRLLLTGVAVAAGISSAMIVLTLKLNPDNYQFVATWLAGSMKHTTWNYVLALVPFIVVIMPYVCYKSRMLNVLNLGEQTATGLGAHVSKQQIVMLAASVGLAGTCVAVSGSIGFVGLIGPHLARRLIGPKHQFLLPTAAAAGALLVIAADTISRSFSTDVPTGIVVAIIGAPYFLYLLAKSKS